MVEVGVVVEVVVVVEVEVGVEVEVEVVVVVEVEVGVVVVVVVVVEEFIYMKITHPCSHPGCSKRAKTQYESKWCGKHRPKEKK